MRPIIKFRYNKARCPLCLADNGSRKQYRSVDAIKEHLNRDHSYNHVYFYTISPTPTYKGNFPFTIHGSCSCECGESVRYPSLTAITPFMPDHGPPYYLSGHLSRIVPNLGNFEKGHIPWNKELKGKGICKPNSGSFKKGDIPANERGGLYTAPNGQVLEWIGGYHPSDPRKYRARSRRIMEEILGRVLRDDEVVIHLDGNPSNDEPYNLKVITRGENCTRNRWGDYRATKVKKPKKQKKVKKESKVEQVAKYTKLERTAELVKLKLLIKPVESTKRPASPFCPSCGMLTPPGSPCPRC